MRGTPIQLYRCLSCMRLLTGQYIEKHGECKCGGARVRGGSPANLFEYIKCFWWSLTIRG